MRGMEEGKRDDEWDDEQTEILPLSNNAQQRTILFIAPFQGLEHGAETDWYD